MLLAGAAVLAVTQRRDRQRQQNLIFDHVVQLQDIVLNSIRLGVLHHSVFFFLTENEPECDGHMERPFKRSQTTLALQYQGAINRAAQHWTSLPISAQAETGIERSSVLGNGLPKARKIRHR